MKKLWTGNDPVRLMLLRAELSARGISFSVRNEDLRIASGELPPTDIWPEIWINDDKNLQEAEDVLGDLQ